MKLVRMVFPIAFIAVCAGSRAQAPAAPAPDSAATLQYIHAAWATLTRSTSDCDSLTDTKTDTNIDAKASAAGVLYMPAEVSAPADVTAAEQKCHIKVMALPKRIEKLGD